MITTIITTTLCPGRDEDDRHEWELNDGVAKCVHCDASAANSIVQIMVPQFTRT